MEVSQLFRRWPVITAVLVLATATLLVSIAGVGHPLSLAALQRGSYGAPLRKDDITHYILDNIKQENIRENLRFLTLRPHLGGTPAERLTAEWTAESWRQQGLDDVRIVPYDVLLSYPHATLPNTVRLVDNTSGGVVWEGHTRQAPLYAPEEGRPDVPFNFNGYSATGDVTAPLVYVHYGRPEDFFLLASRGVTVNGSLVLARYGQVFRANIASLAQANGAVGLILFSDPADYAPRGTSPGDVYPHTVFMPPSAAPLGTVKLVDGDPLTPYYPAIESAFRIPVEEASIPKIPVQPISYEDAKVLLSYLDGPVAPPSWQGGLNLTYHIGPTAPPHRVNLEVHTSNVRTTVYNVIGVMQGSVEPDRYVVLGNHRDAWIFGAVDPSSGSAAMMELGRVLTLLRNETGWRPRRSLVFCSWAAEEYGLVGSVEWVEQYSTLLRDRAVAYLNVDMALEGNYTLRTKAAPLLYDAVLSATKLIPNPDLAEVAAGRPTVYDTWLLRRPDPRDPTTPLMQFIGSGSDYKGFQHNVGVPCLDVRYTHDNETLGEPLYHTLYETFALVDELYDHEYRYHRAVTALWGVLAITLADDLLLPLSLPPYSKFISDAQANIVNKYGAMVEKRNLTLAHFLAAGQKFADDVTNFQQSLDDVDLTDSLAVRRVNDLMMLVERAFIDPRGLPGRPEYNHVVFAPSSSDAYSGTAFCGLTDALSAIAAAPDGEDTEALWRTFEEHLGAVTHLLGDAGAVLAERLW